MPAIAAAPRRGAIRTDGAIVSLVPQTGISWQDHLFGALGGLLAARLLADARRASPA